MFHHPVFRVACLLLCLLGPRIAMAGPWPRDLGTVFMSSTSSFSADGVFLRSESYVEFGLHPQFTIGGSFEVTAYINQYEGFLRWHPDILPEGMAMGVSAGLRYRPYSLAPYQPFVGAEVGRGFEALGGNGWAQAGGRVFAAQAPWGMEYALDLSSMVGLRRGRWLGMLGLTHFETRLNSLTRLRPAIGMDLGRFTLVGEVVIPPSGEVEQVRFGLWQEF